MLGEFWISLPVKDVVKASEFFTTLGFPVDFQYGGVDTGAKLTVGDKNTVIWLYATEGFQKYAGSQVSDAEKTAEVLLSLYVESREMVDGLAKKAVNAGGTIFSPPAEAFGFLYGCGFADLDGHRWNVMYKDESKMPPAK